MPTTHATRTSVHGHARAHDIATHEFRAGRRSAAQTFASDVDEEGLLSGWMGNALVCATMPPVLAALQGLDGTPNKHAKSLVIVWTTLAVALQLFAMTRYWQSCSGKWCARRGILLLIIVLAVSAYIYLAVATFSG